MVLTQDLIMEITRETPARTLEIDELQVGQDVIQRITFSNEMVSAFSDICGDYAPVHHDIDHANEMGYDRPIVHGILVASPFSRLLGMHLPGKHAVLQTVEFKMRLPVYCEEELTYRAVITDIRRPFKIVRLDLTVSADGRHRVTGESQCMLLGQ